MVVGRKQFYSAERQLVRLRALEPVQDVGHRVGEPVHHPALGIVVDGSEDPGDGGEQSDPAHAHDDAGEGERDHAVTQTP